MMVDLKKKNIFDTFVRYAWENIAVKRLNYLISIGDFNLVI